MSTRMDTFSSRVNTVLGICEEQSKVYQEYIARAPEQTTTHSATSIVSFSGSAAEQDSTSRRKR